MLSHSLAARFDISPSIITSVINNSEGQSNGLLLFPNPSGDLVNILVPEGSEQLIIYDAQGRLVASQQNLSSNTMRIDVGEWADGIYVVNILTDGLPISTKFIEQ